MLPTAARPHGGKQKIETFETLKCFNNSFQTVYWLIEACRGNATCQEATTWICLFNPIFFPITSILWHVKLLWRTARCGQRAYQDRYTKSAVLNCIHAFTSSAFQTVLQTTMLIVQWKDHDFEYHLIQLGHLLSSAVALAYHSSTHHFHAKSGKSQAPHGGQIISGFFFFLYLYGSRMVGLAFLAAYLKAYFLIIPAVLIVWNVVVAYFLIKTDNGKTWFTSVASITVPIAFVSKEHLDAFNASLSKHTGNVFFRYHLFNQLGYTLVVCTAFSLLFHYILPNNIMSYTCNNVPSTTCLEGCEWEDVCIDGELGAELAIAVPCLLSWLAIPLQKCLIPGFYGRHDEIDSI